MALTFLGSEDLGHAAPPSVRFEARGLSEFCSSKPLLAAACVSLGTAWVLHSLWPDFFTVRPLSAPALFRSPESDALTPLCKTVSVPHRDQLWKTLWLPPAKDPPLIPVFRLIS